MKLHDIMQYPEVGLTRLDAAENLFFRRELEHIIPEMFEVEFARINARNIFPIDRSAGPAAETITYRQFTKTGMAKIIADYANDIPLVNTYGQEFTAKVRSAAIAARWSLQEIRAAARAGRPLDRMQAEAAREALLRLENGIAFAGDADYGLVGLFSDPNIPSAVAPNGAGGFPEWSTKTAAEILEDMNAVANQIVETTLEVEAPDTMLLPTAQFNLIASTPAGTGTDTTILRYFLNNNPYIREVMSVRELDGAGPAGVDVVVAYARNPAKLRLNVPLDIEQLAPQENDLTVKVPYHMRIGGLQVIKPLSINILEDI